MSKDDAAKLLSWILGVAAVLGLLALIILSINTNSLDFKGQTRLSHVALWLGIPISLGVIGTGILRTEHRARKVTLIVGFLLVLLWIWAAVGMVPVS